MQNSDLIEVITVLTADERERLADFFGKKHIGAKAEVIRLVHFILECLKEEKSSALQRMDAYAYLFPGQVMVENKLEKTMSEALSFVRKFIGQEGAIGQINDMRQIFLLQKFYHERGLGDKCKTAYRQIIKAKEKPENWTPEEYYTHFMAEKEEMYTQSIQNHGKDDLNLRNTMVALTEYYMVEKLWLTCQILIQNQVTLLDLPPLNDLALIDMDSPNLQWFFDKPLGQLFKKTIHLLYYEEAENIKDLRDLIALLRRYENRITKQDFYLFEISACNLGIRRVNKGNFAYLEVVFQIQQERVNSGRVYGEKGQISASEFLSILTNSFRLNALNWGKEFIENHKKRIIGVMASHQYYEYALANYYFEVKKYDETRLILMTSDYDDIRCRMAARILEIKSLYELSILEGTDHRVGEYLEDRVEAGILFFFRLKDVEPRKKRMGKRFADTVKRIIHAKGNRDISRLKKIGDDIQAAELIAERQWLLGIIDDLTKGMD